MNNNQYKITQSFNIINLLLWESLYLTIYTHCLCVSIALYSM